MRNLSETRGMRPLFIASVLALASFLLLTRQPGVWPASSQALAQDHRALVNAAWTEDKIDLEQLFDSVIDAVNKNFFDQAALSQGIWRGHAQAIRPSVLNSPTAGDAVRQINELLAELGASHTALYTPNDDQYYVLLDILGGGQRNRRFWGSGLYYPGLGVFTHNVDGRNFADSVLEGSPAEKAGLKFGDEILSVDGRPYSPIESFQGKIGKPAELLIRRAANAEPEPLTATAVPIRPMVAFSDATEASARVIERNGNHIGYIHVWELAESSSFGNALHAISGKADSLIIDLRGRVGGNMGVAGRLLQDLDGGNYWGGSYGFTRSPQEPVEPAPKGSFRSRSALLIDQHTRSAGEIMAYGYKRSAFGPIFGTRSAGAVLSAALFPMPGDTVLYLAVSGLEIDGHSLEGTGVAPDYPVERPLPYAHGADPVLEAAANFLSHTVTK
jgi:carboxyl-terminal processing protease